jgi:hypothetical protein
MPEYFIPEGVPRRWIVTLWALICAGVIGGLVWLYGSGGVGESFGLAAVYVVVLLGGALLYDVAARFLTLPAGRVGIVGLELVLSLGVGWGVSVLSGWYDPVAYVRLIPLLLLGGGMAWIGGVFLLRRRPEEPETLEAPDEREAVTPPVKREIIDWIPVKKGSDIHIVRIDELLYVQAEGDYVMLHTPDGRFIKEQTMHWFEKHLPDHFVRIHRSSIVNIDRIARVELFGKENHHVRLKEGTVLKASVNGYRMLKLRLDL